MTTSRRDTRQPPAQVDAKALGAFYTDTQVAGFLVRWALRSPRDRVMDPSFGGGVFLRAACDRLLTLAGEPATQVWGVELDDQVHAQTVKLLAEDYGLTAETLLNRDFFDLVASPALQMDAVVGNPPFIRYQRFSGAARERALGRAAQQGVRLTRLSSSWAPFVVHSTAMLRPGGRLAMVIPVEIGHAAYALPVLDYLRRSFGRLAFLTFRKKLFPDLSEDTLLILADDKGRAAPEIALLDLPDSGRLEDLEATSVPNGESQVLPAERLALGQERLVEYLIPRKARDLYQQLKRDAVTQRLGDLADVGIGYVTGANEFFHLGPDEVQRWDIPEAYLRPAVRRGRALAGLRFTLEDWHAAVASGEAGYLLHIPEGWNLPESVRHYLRHGEVQGVSETYKCRTRSPWYRVPHVYQPDAFLSYMSGATPYLVANDAGVVAPNSLHILRLHHGSKLPSAAIAALWQTSLTRLSVEIEGHPLGGGMLKLEPTEAERVLLAAPPSENGSLVALAAEFDLSMRRGESAAVRSQADAVFLQEGIGLSRSDCQLLQAAAESLRERRYSRGAR